MKKRLIILVMSVIPALAFSQTDIQMSQHMFNRAVYNPAYTGASKYFNIYGHWRDQWQDWSGAPQTMYLTAHNYFPEIKSGLGIVALKDKLGFERHLNFKVSYAYHVFLNDESYISFGLSAGVINRNTDWTKATVADASALGGVIPTEKESKWSADFDFGVEYNRENFTAGLSVTHLNKTANKSRYNNMGHHFYGYVKYMFDLGVDFDLTPSLFVANSKKSTHLEANAILTYRKKMWVGASFRTNEKFKSESVVGIIGMDVADFLRIGYSFDYNIGEIGEYGGNTHEVMLGIRLAKNPHIYAKTPRFFE